MGKGTEPSITPLKLKDDNFTSTYVEGVSQ